MVQISYEGIFEDNVDAFLAGEIPVVPAPRRGGLTMPQTGYRYVLGTSGVAVQAATPLIEATAPLVTWTAKDGPRLGELPVGIEFPRGKPPVRLLHEARGRATATAPDEWAGLIVHDGKDWQLIVPEPQQQGPAHISYSRDCIGEAELFLDLHTHGDGPAFFSKTDDADDVDGVYFAGVLGQCREQEPSVALRLVIHGHHFEATYRIESLFDASGD